MVLTNEIHAIELAGRNRLEIRRGRTEDDLRLVAPGGALTLSITVTDAGAVLRVEGAALLVQSSGAVAIDAASVTIRGRDAVTLVSGGDAHIVAAGHLNAEADSIGVHATVGDVEVRANDDVRLDGERVRMNC
jgi:hypothetical protein